MQIFVQNESSILTKMGLKVKAGWFISKTPCFQIYFMQILIHRFSLDNLSDYNMILKKDEKKKKKGPICLISQLLSLGSFLKSFAFVCSHHKLQLKYMVFSLELLFCYFFPHTVTAPSSALFHRCLKRNPK